MKKILKVIGIGLLTCFSFYYTDKIVDVIKEKDEIMIAIREKEKDLNVLPTNATINDDFIIPGISGMKIDIKKSYARMKSVGEYNENLLVFINDYPTVSITNTYDKYIKESNKERREVSLIINSDDINYLKSVLMICKENDIAITVFIDGLVLDQSISFFTENKDYFNLENLGYNDEYTRSKIKYTNSLINEIYGSKSNFCYLDDEDDSVLDMCMREEMHTMIPLKVNEKTPYSYIKNNLSIGQMYSFDDNDYTMNELDSIIKFIIQKGYKIVSLGDLIKE